MLERVDKLLVAAGLVSTRTQAQRLIHAGAVQGCLQGQWFVLTKSAQKIAADTRFQIALIDELKYVSRAGLKLDKALSHLGDKEVLSQAQIILDIGQSTGGFTDCLLQHGVGQVVGVDVGHDQLEDKLRKDPRVTCFEGINARELPAQTLMPLAPTGYDGAVMDVSFISQTLILPSLLGLVRSGGQILALVKPQFEVGKSGVAKGGLVKDASLFKQVEDKIKQAYQNLDCRVLNYFPSELPGTDGNQEFFILVQKI